MNRLIVFVCTRGEHAVSVVVSVYSRVRFGVNVWGLRHDETVRYRLCIDNRFVGNSSVVRGRRALRAGRREEEARVHADGGRAAARQPQA